MANVKILLDIFDLPLLRILYMFHQEMRLLCIATHSFEEIFSLEKEKRTSWRRPMESDPDLTNEQWKKTEKQSRTQKNVPDAWWWWSYCPPIFNYLNGIWYCTHISHTLAHIPTHPYLSHSHTHSLSLSHRHRHTQHTRTHVLALSLPIFESCNFDLRMCQKKRSALFSG